MPSTREPEKRVWSAGDESSSGEDVDANASATSQRCPVCQERFDPHEERTVDTVLEEYEAAARCGISLGDRSVDQ